MKQPAIICDVNGCLSSCEGRKHFIADPENRDWEGFFKHMMTDTPIDMVHRFVNAQREWPFYNDVILITGAPEKYRPLMEEWLDKNQVQYDRLFMRGNYQFIKGFEFKEKLLTEQLKGQYQIVLALDDRQECAVIYRKHSIPCWVTAEESYERVQAQPYSNRQTHVRQYRDRGRRPRPR